MPGRLTALLAPLLIALAGSAAPLQGEDPPRPDPTPEAIAAAVKELDGAFGEGKTPERVAAIERAARIASPKVIERVAKGLSDGDPLVRAAAIEALRFTPHADALAALHGLAKRDKELRKDAALHAKLLKAIAQHGDVKSLPLLVDGGLAGEPAVLEARILGIANVRSPRAVEELVGLMRVAERARVDACMRHFRLALMRLTGVDHGLSQDKWLAWWNASRKGLEVAAEPPLLPADLQRAWNVFWGLPLDYDRGTKRGERGK